MFDMTQYRTSLLMPVCCTFAVLVSCSAGAARADTSVEERLRKIEATRAALKAMWMGLNHALHNKRADTFFPLPDGSGAGVRPVTGYDLEEMPGYYLRSARHAQLVQFVDRLENGHWSGIPAEDCAAIARSFRGILTSTGPWARVARPSVGDSGDSGHILAAKLKGGARQTVRELHQYYSDTHKVVAELRSKYLILAEDARRMEQGSIDLMGSRMDRAEDGTE